MSFFSNLSTLFGTQDTGKGQAVAKPKLKSIPPTPLNKKTVKSKPVPAKKVVKAKPSHIKKNINTMIRLAKYFYILSESAIVKCHFPG